VKECRDLIIDLWKETEMGSASGVISYRRKEKGDEVVSLQTLIYLELK